jgi:hypothetical protein
MLANKAIRRVHDFTCLGSKLSEDGGACKDVKIRIRKARGAFTRLRKTCLAHYVNKDTKIKLFNVDVKSVGYYCMGVKPGWLHVGSREIFSPL